MISLGTYDFGVMISLGKSAMSIPMVGSIFSKNYRIPGLLQKRNIGANVAPHWKRISRWFLKQNCRAVVPRGWNKITLPKKLPYTRLPLQTEPLDERSSLTRANFSMIFKTEMQGRSSCSRRKKPHQNRRCRSRDIEAEILGGNFIIGCQNDSNEYKQQVQANQQWREDHLSPVSRAWF